MRIRTARQLQATTRGRRAELRLTQQVVADRAGLSRKWVSDFERGKTGVELEPVLRLLGALDLWVDVGADPAQPTVDVVHSAPPVRVALSADDVDLDAHLEGLMDR